MHDTKSLCLRALARLPVVIPIWFFAIIFPFFGPINSAVGALLVTFTVYVIPASAHMLTYKSASARQVNSPISAYISHICLFLPNYLSHLSSFTWYPRMNFSKIIMYGHIIC